MKYAIVNLKDSFGRDRLKVRPCIIINESAKHARCLLMTNHPNKKSIKTSFFLQDGNFRSWINAKKTYTVRKSFVEREIGKVPPHIEKTIKTLMNRYEQKNYVCHF